MNCRLCDSKIPPNRSQCPNCGTYNVEDSGLTESETVPLSEVESAAVGRIQTGPWDPCFGLTLRGKNKGSAGIVRTSVNLLGGAPGAGKSTLSIMLADRMCEATDSRALYIGSEQALGETKMLAEDLDLGNLSRILMLRRVDEKAKILSPSLLALRPCVVIIDSLPGLLGDDLQEAVRLCMRFKQYACALDAPVILIDHINKEGDLAGLMALQHGVDSLLTLNLGKKEQERILRTVKNRNGIAPYEVKLKMTEKGLEAA